MRSLVFEADDCQSGTKGQSTQQNSYITRELIIFGRTTPTCLKFEIFDRFDDRFWEENSNIWRVRSSFFLTFGNGTIINKITKM